MAKKRRSEVRTDGQMSIRWKRVGEDGSRPLKRRDSLCKVQGGRGTESSRPLWLEHVSEEKRDMKRTQRWAGNRSQEGSYGTAAETLDGSEREREREWGWGHLCLFITTQTSGGMSKVGSMVQPEWKYDSQDRGHLAVHIKEVGSFSWGAAG